ncbi:MAG: alpha-1,4-glucan--maltose-1-phosphate maltosyltransferase [Vicinamibacterales bacterium]
MNLPAEGRRRVIIEAVTPEIDAGRHPIKRTPGEVVVVEADLFADGHDRIAAVVLHRPAGEADWAVSPMTLVTNDRWRGSFTCGDVGREEYTVEAWVDHFATWQHDLEKRVAAGQDVRSELLEGAAMVRAAGRRAATGEEREWFLDCADQLVSERPVAERTALALRAELGERMAAAPDRRFASRHPRILGVTVDRERARTGAWYEFFPRSASPDPTRSATFREAAARLPEIGASGMGFDVVYLPPIHPIGRTNRKGKGNTLVPEPGDPGSPWAIGGPEGGHTAIEPGLGTHEDFRRFIAEAARHGLEVAIDIAWQCSPDHPYVKSHPEWFRHRPDGTIKYAENPPKKYQDIYPFEFETDQWEALWEELRDVVLFWVDQGVRIFRVDNPHTKAMPFWEWMIAEVHERDPGVIFLSEAFTRPKVMKHLAKIGFTQSYTYFTWRNTRAELEEYLTELTQTEMREYYRPNFFANTPDILHAFLQQGGINAFKIRFVLAATLAATYGIYSSFEIGENRAVPGSEEYLHSEKYQFRQWDWERPGHIKDLIARVNRIRREHRAFQFNEGLRFHLSSNDRIIAYSKTAPGGQARLLTVVSLDPSAAQDGTVCVSLPDDPVGDGERYRVRDLLTGAAYDWQGPWNYVRLDPAAIPAHILLIERVRTA